MQTFLAYGESSGLQIYVFCLFKIKCINSKNRCVCLCRDRLELVAQLFPHCWHTCPPRATVVPEFFDCFRRRFSLISVGKANRQFFSTSLQFIGISIYKSKLYAETSIGLFISCFAFLRPSIQGRSSRKTTEGGGSSNWIVTAAELGLWFLSNLLMEKSQLLTPTDAGMAEKDSSRFF